MEYKNKKSFQAGIIWSQANKSILATQKSSPTSDYIKVKLKNMNQIKHKSLVRQLNTNLILISY